MADECEADRSRVMFDRARLRQAERCEHVPPMPADVSVDNHELLLTTFWKQCLTQACPRLQCVERNK